MPIHTFQCEFCGHVFEELIRRESDEEELVCPKCGATRPNRRLSAPAKVSAGSTGFGGGFTGGGCGSGGG